MNKMKSLKILEAMISKNDLVALENEFSTVEYNEKKYEKMFELACFCGNIDVLRLIMKYKKMQIFVTDAFLHLSKEYHKDPDRFLKCAEFMIDTHKWEPGEETPYAMFWSVFENNEDRRFLNYISRFTPTDELNSYINHLMKIIKDINFKKQKYENALTILKETYDQKIKESILKEIGNNNQSAGKRKI